MHQRMVNTSFSNYLVLILLTISGLNGQTPAMVHWSCMVPDSQHVSSTGGNLQGFDQSSSPGFVVRDYNNGPGPDQRWWPFAAGAAIPWGEETARVTTRFVEFSVTPAPGFTFQADSLNIRLGAKGTTNLRADVLIALDPDFNVTMTLNPVPIPLIADSDELFSWALGVPVGEGDILYVRIYPWYQGAPSTSKYLYVRDATILGSTQGVVYPAQAAWSLTNPDLGGTGGTVELSEQLGGMDQDLHGLEVYNYGGPGQSQSLNISGGAWPANQTAPLSSAYSAFRIMALPGYRFTSSQISMHLSAVGTQVMKARVLYSLDPEFIDPQEIAFSTGDSTEHNYLLENQLHDIVASASQVVDPGQILELRVYPWVDAQTNQTSNAYLCLKAIQVAGNVETVMIIDPPTVSTAPIRFISTTFCSSGGTIASDGGAPVTQRGVCWSTSPEPLYSENFTIDGEGSGAFESNPQDLLPATTYYLRAYALNTGGVAYGDERTFTTLSTVVPPGVGTLDVSNVLVQTAQAGGSVFSWGGSDVIARGVCWNTDGEPTLADAHSDDGAGLGTFNSLISGLLAETTYYVRAYATNAAGVAYGNEVSFTTQAPAPPIHRTVAQDGSGDYLTVQAAFDAVPDYYTGTYTISVRAGTYYEKLYLDRAKINVILRGESAESTILTYDDYAGIAGGTSMSYSVAIDADDFTARDITFQNTVVNDGSVGDQQGVALRVNGDRQAYYHCRLLGYQDTFYTWGGRGTGRVYMNACYIEGSVDFIFGRDIVVFDSCQIHINRNGGSLTAAATEAESDFGYVFRDCEITADEIGFDGNPITSFLLGRPWQAAPRTVFLRCSEPASLSAAGWAAWNVVPALYAEYMCTGPGSDYSNRHAISRQLTDLEAEDYTILNIFSRNSSPNLGYDWLPPGSGDAVRIDPGKQMLPETFSLGQNYPNPFNPSTIIEYAIPRQNHVELLIFDVTGKLVITAVNQVLPAGSYQVGLFGHALSSGVYLYQLRSESFVETRKMIVLK